VSEPPYPVRYRVATPDDVGFLLSSWLESWHDGCPLMRTVRFRDFKPAARAMAVRLLASSVAMVACDPDDETAILGYAVGEPRVEGGPLLHYVYVRHSRRRHGLAKALVERCRAHIGAPKWAAYTHETYVTRRIDPARKPAYDPFRAWGVAC